MLEWESSGAEVRVEDLVKVMKDEHEACACLQVAFAAAIAAVQARRLPSPLLSPQPPPPLVAVSRLRGSLLLVDTLI